MFTHLKETWQVLKSMFYESEEEEFQIENFQFKYNEDKFLENAFKHIQSTYGGYYAAGKSNDSAQLVDVWASDGTAVTTSINLAQKYLQRYGKKNGYNQSDLLKAVHYIAFASYFSKKLEEERNEK